MFNIKYLGLVSRTLGPERKNPHTPIYGVKEFVCLSVTNFDPNYLVTGRTEWAVIYLFIYLLSANQKEHTSVRCCERNVRSMQI